MNENYVNLKYESIVCDLKELKSKNLASLSIHGLTSWMKAKEKEKKWKKKIRKKLGEKFF